MSDDAITCEACSPTSGEPICSRTAEYWHRVTPDDEEKMAICHKHKCKRCEPMPSEPESADNG